MTNDLPNIATLSLDSKDDMLECIVALADQSLRSGVDLLDSAIFELGTLRAVSDAIAIFAELFDRSMTTNDEKLFLELLVAIREHADTIED
jgi:uncharacterized UPF0160 family protein